MDKTKTKFYSVAIIGTGPGGYETAIRLNQLNISVICFEKEKIGGICLNKGCIPTKTLVKSADLYHEMKNAVEFGLENYLFDINYEKIFLRKNKTVEKLVSGIEFIFKKRDIPLVKGTIHMIEKMNGHYIVYTENDMFTCDYVIIATGSKPKSLHFLPFDQKLILSSDDILDMNTLPKNLTIIGGGVIGCEFASIFNQLGVQVTIIEYLSNIVSTEDEEVSKRLLIALKKTGIKVFTETTVLSGKNFENKIELTLKSNKDDTITTTISEKVLISVGRYPFFDIVTTGFELFTENGFIKINECCQTNEDKIFAIGDVTGKLMLAHTASKQGFLVADFIKHSQDNTTNIDIPKPKNCMTIKPINYENIPRCIFTTPEVASCGYTEEKAKKKYSDIKIGRFPYSANGKAMATGSTFGFVKTIIDANTNELIGMHIIGYLATELIAQASIIIHTRTKVDDVANIVFAHPTISECIMESIEDTHKMAIHTI